MDRWKRGHNVGGRGKSFNCFLSSFVPGILMRTKVRISFFSATEIELKKKKKVMPVHLRGRSDFNH